MRLTHLAIAAVGLLPAVPAQAVLNVQLIGGQRTGAVKQSLGNDKETTEITSRELGLALHTNPLEEVPFSFGLAVFQQSYDLSPAAEKSMDAIFSGSQNRSFFNETAEGTMKGLIYGPELMAWVPLGMFEPFLRVSYLMGNYETEETLGLESKSGVTPKTKIDTTVSGEAESTGAFYGVGVRISPAPMFDVFAEYNIGKETHENQETVVETFSKQGGEVQQDSKSTLDRDDMDDEDKDEEFGTKSIRLGLQFGF